MYRFDLLFDPQLIPSLGKSILSLFIHYVLVFCFWAKFPQKGKMFFNATVLLKK